MFWDNLQADPSTLILVFQKSPEQQRQTPYLNFFSSLPPAVSPEVTRLVCRDTSRFLFRPAGTKHKTMLEARSGVGSIKSFPRPGVKSKLASSSKSSTGLQNKTFYCETCDVHVNSETQLKQVRFTDLETGF